MAKIQIKSEKLTPFGGIFSIMDTALSFKTVRKSLVLVCKIIIFAHSDAGSTA